MGNKVNRLDKDLLAPYFERWDSVKDSIENLYSNRDEKAKALMSDAIDNYCNLLECGGKEINERTGSSEFVLLPLNGNDRFEFIKERINSHYAHVQLSALYLESKKKAARLYVMKK